MRCLASLGFVTLLACGAASGSQSTAPAGDGQERTPADMLARWKTQTPTAACLEPRQVERAWEEYSPASDGGLIIYTTRIELGGDPRQQQELTAQVDDCVTRASGHAATSKSATQSIWELDSLAQFRVSTKTIADDQIVDLELTRIVAPPTFAVEALACVQRSARLREFHELLGEPQPNRCSVSFQNGEQGSVSFDAPFMPNAGLEQRARDLVDKLVGDGWKHDERSDPTFGDSVIATSVSEGWLRAVRLEPDRVTASVSLQ